MASNNEERLKMKVKIKNLWIKRKWSGIINGSGTDIYDNNIKIAEKTYAHLADANDDGKTFVEIAEWIRENWRRL